MTTYEFFEGWMTPKEWRTYKRYTVNRLIVTQGVSRDTAKAIRDRHLRQEISFDPNIPYQLADAWEDMINYRLRWADTPEGHSYWEQVNRRAAPIRALPPMTIVINNVN